MTPELSFNVTIDESQQLVTVSHSLGPIRAFRPDQAYWSLPPPKQRERAIARYVQDVRVLETDPDRINEQLHEPNP